MTFVQRRLLGFVVLCGVGGLGALAVLWDQKRAGEQEKSEAAAAKVLALVAAADVHKLQLMGPKGSFTLERRGEQDWRLTSPLETPAEATTVDAMLQHLAQLSRTRVVGTPVEGGGVTPPADLAALSLAPPLYTVTLTRADGELETLHVGKRAAFDGSIFVKLPGRPEVMVVPGGLLYQVDKDLFALRDKRLATFDPDRVSAVEARVDGRLVYGLERQGTDWALVAPRRAPAERAQVSGLLSALSNLRAKGFASETSDPQTRAAHGLSPAKAELDLTLADGGKLTLLLGQVAGAEQAAYYAARAVDGSPILEVGSDYALKRVLTGASDLVDKHVLRFEREQVRGLRLQRGDEALAFEKRPDEDKGRDVWHLTAPHEAPAQDALVAGLLYRLSSLQAATIHDEEATEAQLEAAGIGAPALTVELLGEGGTSLGGILFGQEQHGVRFAAARGGRRLCLVEASQASEISTRAADYLPGAAARLASPYEELDAELP